MRENHCRGSFQFSNLLFTRSTLSSLPRSHAIVHFGRPSRLAVFNSQAGSMHAYCNDRQRLCRTCGLVSGVCLADFGLNVVCVDKDSEKISALTRRETPIFEPGLDELRSRKADPIPTSASFFGSKLTSSIIAQSGLPQVRQHKMDRLRRSSDNFEKTIMVCEPRDIFHRQKFYGKEGTVQEWEAAHIPMIPTHLRGNRNSTDVLSCCPNKRCNPA
jgi:hypothetical protein